MTTVTETDGSEQDELLQVPLAPLRPALEAVLMVADQPLDTLTLASAVGYPSDEVTAALVALAEEYTEQGRGFELRNVAGGWRYYTREEYAVVVEGFVLDGQRARLTQAALETLAVVAYKQPVSRARVSAIRGVNVDGVMRTLLARGLSMRWLVWLGQRSYALYLWHYLWVTWTHGLPLAVGMPLGIAAALGCTVLSWRFVEKPALAWGRRRTSRPRTEVRHEGLRRPVALDRERATQAA